MANLIAHKQPVVNRIRRPVDKWIVPNRRLSSKVTSTITNTDHDGWENDDPGSWLTAGAYGLNIAPIGQIGGATGIGSFHYANVAVPKDARIVSAELRVYWMYSTGTPAALVHGVNADDPAIASGSNLPSGRSITTGMAVTNIPAGGATGEVFINVKDIIQTIVNRSGWASGANMWILLKDNSSTNNHYASVAMIGNANSNGTPLSITYWDD
jgi:hypothetical protein